MSSLTTLQLTENEMRQQVVRNQKILLELRNNIHMFNNLANNKKVVKDEEALLTENAKLKSKVNDLLNQVIFQTVMNGERHIPLPSSGEPQPKVEIVPETKTIEKVAPKKEVKKEEPAQKSKAPAPKASDNVNRNSAPPKQNETKAAAPATDSEVHVGRLDMRIGRIVEVSRHPDADSLYIEKVDVGEANPRTIISGLVKHVPIEEMQNRLAVFLCNLKAAKMRGILSEGMIMCASCPDRGVQILDVPSGCQPGDRVFVPGFETVPDSQLNPKKKIWETVKPDLRVNSEGIACYQGVPWQVQNDKGIVKAKSLLEAQIQ